MYQWTHESIDRRKPISMEWDELHRRLGASPLLHADFLSSALSVFGSDREVMFKCTSGGNIVCLAVLQPVGTGKWATFQPSQAPIGFWLQSPGHSMAKLIETCHASMSLTTAVVSLTQQDPDILPRPADEARLSTLDYIDTARIVVQGDWATYWAQRGSNLRHNLKRAKAKLGSASRSLALRVISNRDELRGAVAVYGQIESSSWKASEGTAVSPDNDQGRFYTLLLERFAARERAICYQLLIDGEVAATDLCIAGDEEIVILKTTYDDRFKDYSPAFLMREIAFQWIFEQRSFARIEFYGRVMDWHLRWTDHVRRMYHVNHFRFAVLKRLAQQPRTTAEANAI
jgi:hypothetical protein